MIQHPLEIPRAIHEAFHIARTGPPGPGRRRHPDRPLARRHPVRAGHRRRTCPATSRRPRATPSRSARPPRRWPARGGRCSTPAAASSTPTRRPSSSSSRRSDRFPVTCTLHGPRRASRRPHDQWLGMLGMHGTRTANYAMDEADLICAIGARFDDRITGKLSEFAPRAKFIHIDIDPAEISKNVPAHIPIVGDAKNILAKLVERVPRAGGRQRAAGRVVAAHPRLAGSATRCATRTPTTPRSSRSDMVEALYEATGGDCILTTDIGQHQMWAAQYFHFDAPAPVDQLRRPGDDGLRPARRDGRQGRLPRRGRGLHRRRRLGPDEHAGARDVRRGGHRRQGLHHEQRLPGHGPPVAGAVLGPAATRTSHAGSGRTSSSSPRPTAAPACAAPTRRRSSSDCARRSTPPARSSSTSRVTREENVYPMIAPGAGRAGHGGLSHGRARNQESC